MRGHSSGTIYRKGEVIPYVEVWRQPLSRWLVSQAYHQWERWTEPLARRASGWHRRLLGEGLGHIPLVNRRDIRCDRLSQRGRVSLAIIHVTWGQHDAIVAKPDNTRE